MSRPALCFERRNDGIGLPSGAGVAPLGIFDITGRPGLVMPRYEVGSKTVVRLDAKTGVITRVGSSKHLNARSIQDLEKIRSLLNQHKVSVGDLQFLIGRDGRVVVNDPLSVVQSKPSRRNLRMISLLIQAAQENLK